MQHDALERMEDAQKDIERLSAQRAPVHKRLSELEQSLSELADDASAYAKAKREIEACTVELDRIDHLIVRARKQVASAEQLRPIERFEAARALATAARAEVLDALESFGRAGKALLPEITRVLTARTASCQADLAAYLLGSQIGADVTAFDPTRSIGATATQPQNLSTEEWTKLCPLLPAPKMQGRFVMRPKDPNAASAVAGGMLVNRGQERVVDIADVQAKGPSYVDQLFAPNGPMTLLPTAESIAALDQARPSAHRSRETAPV